MDATRTRRGFTLVELMITVALIGIIGLISAPGLFRSIPNYRVNSAARVLATEVNLARMRAIAKNKVHTIKALAGTDQKIEIYEAGNATAIKTITFAANGASHKNVSLGRPTGITPAGAGLQFIGSNVEMRPNGLLSSAGDHWLYISPTADVSRTINWTDPGDCATYTQRFRAIKVTRAGQTTQYRYTCNRATTTWSWEEL